MPPAVQAYIAALAPRWREAETVGAEFGELIICSVFPPGAGAEEY